MDTQSVIKQKEAGTYDRNLLIVRQYQPGLGGLLGKKYHVKRQRINQIVKRGRQLAKQGEENGGK